MKQLKYCSFLIALFLLSACTKIEVFTPELEVEAVSTTVKVGELATFKFSGDPDHITFYSGEVTKEYAFKDGRTLPSEGILASFSTNVRYGTDPRHPDLLSVWVSTDFNGNYTIEDVKAANWTDTITGNFTLAPETHTGTTEATSVPSGKLNIAPNLPTGTKVYFAYKYKKTPRTEGGNQRNWFTYKTLLENKTSLSHLADDPLANKLADGKEFKLVYDGLLRTNTAFQTSTVFTATGNMTLRVPDLDPVWDNTVEVWAISPAIVIPDAVDNGPDKGIAIKSFADTRIQEYKHIYTEPGVYKATFVAINSNISGAKEIVREVVITVTE